MAQYTHPSKTKFIFTIRFHQWTKNKINYKMKSVQKENKTTETKEINLSMIMICNRIPYMHCY